ncbi:hypothetical protein G9A89_004584 [Geosiphon pyriformis]|nr:hypothetical protein G9A89_004584 [Geosiphon pyriformis]
MPKQRASRPSIRSRKDPSSKPSITKRSSTSKDPSITTTLLNGITAEDIPFPEVDLVKRVLASSRRTKNRRSDPPRPPNGFFLFRNALHSHLADMNLKVPQVSMAAGLLWEKALPETRAHYTNLQNIAKQWHLKMYPGYVYRPRRSSATKKSISNEALVNQQLALQNQAQNIQTNSNLKLKKPSLKLDQQLQGYKAEEFQDFPKHRNEPAIFTRLPQHPNSPATTCTTMSGSSLHSPPLSPITPTSTSTSTSIHHHFKNEPDISALLPSQKLELYAPIPRSAESFILPSPPTSRKISYVEAYQMAEMARLHRNFMFSHEQHELGIPHQNSQPQQFLPVHHQHQSNTWQPVILEPQIDPVLSADVSYGMVGQPHSLQQTNNIFGSQSPIMASDVSTAQQICASQESQTPNYDTIGFESNQFTIGINNNMTLNTNQVNGYVGHRSDVFQDWIEY